jgi:hypothetical protein
VLKGRLRRYEIAVIRRAITRVQRAIVTADRGFADVALVDVLTALGVEFILRVKGRSKGACAKNCPYLGYWLRITKHRK